MTPDDLESVCELLLEQSIFSAGQWGIDKAAAKGRLPASFVPRHWAAATDKARVELCKLAEMQLEQYVPTRTSMRDASLVSVVFGQGATSRYDFKHGRASISLVPAFPIVRKHGSAGASSGKILLEAAFLGSGTRIRTHHWRGSWKDAKRRMRFCPSYLSASRWRNS